MAALDALNKIPASRKILVGLLLLILVGAGWYFLFYADLDGKIKKLDDEYNSVQAAMQRAIEDNRAYNELVQKLFDAKKEVDALNQILPKDRDIEGLMKSISAQAKTARLRLTNIVPEDEVDAPDYYVKLPIKIEFRGTFHQVLHFFHLIDQAVTRLINLENITLELAATEEEPYALRGSVLATTFMAKEQQNVDPNAPPPAP